MADASIDKDRHLYRLFSRWLRDAKGLSFDIRRLSRPDAQAFLLWMDSGRVRPPGEAYSPRMKFTAFDLARRVLDTLVARGLALSNPWDRVKLPRPAQEPRRIPSVEEVARFLDGIPTAHARELRDRALFETLYATGLRPKEAGTLRWEDVDLPRRMIHVHSTKVARDRVVPLIACAAGFLAAWQMAQGLAEYVFEGAKPLSTDAIACRFALYATQACFESCAPYVLRHACASHLLAQGADLRYVQALLGHESLETTVLYTTAQEEELKRHYKRFHPREGLLWRELSEAELAAFARLMEDLKRAGRKRERRRILALRDAEVGLH
jgi:site-specific recombinase XerD